MCTDDTAAAHRHQPNPHVLHDFEPRVVFDLEPVDSVTVTTLMGNVTDAFMPDQGPAHRPPLPVFHGGRQPAPTMEDGDVPEVPLADGGFAVIVNICRYARRLTNERAIHAVMGGFHLNGPIFDPLIPRVLNDLGGL